MCHWHKTRHKDRCSYVYIVRRVLTKVPRSFNGEMLVFLWDAEGVEVTVLYNFFKLEGAICPCRPYLLGILYSPTTLGCCGSLVGERKIFQKTIRKELMTTELISPNMRSRSDFHDFCSSTGWSFVF